jgi:hypothetical protein
LYSTALKKARVFVTFREKALPFQAAGVYIALRRQNGISPLVHFYDNFAFPLRNG